MTRMMVGLRVNRCELDELWSYVGKKQKNVTQRELAVKGPASTVCWVLAPFRSHWSLFKLTGGPF